MMTSRTGNDAGFSLIELLLTVSFVLMGSLLIQGSFLRAAGVFGRYTHTLQAMVWADREAARTREALLYGDGAESGAGTVEFGGKTCEWTRTVEMPGDRSLYDIRVALRWTEGGKPVEWQNESYAYKKEILQGA